MSRMRKRAAPLQTYALCAAIGLFAGLGLSPIFGDTLLSTAGGMLAGLVAGRVFTRAGRSRKRR